MALFEEFGKKISGAGQGMAKQTKDYLEISRINAVISDQEKMIQQLYARIGEAYFRRHYQDPEAEEREAIEQIKGLYNEISRNKKAIDTVRGIIRCPRCGTEVPITMPFCGKCGLKMPLPVQPQQAQGQPLQAPQPGTAQQGVIQPGVGQPVFQVQPSIHPMESPVRPVGEAQPGFQASPAAQPEGPICSECGSRMRPGQLFCSVCGSKLEAAVPEPVMDLVEDLVSEPASAPVEADCPESTEEPVEIPTSEHISEPEAELVEGSSEALADLMSDEIAS